MLHKKGHKDYANYQGGRKKKTRKKVMLDNAATSKHLFGIKRACLALAK